MSSYPRCPIVNRSDVEGDCRIPHAVYLPVGALMCSSRRVPHSLSQRGIQRHQNRAVMVLSNIRTSTRASWHGRSLICLAALSGAHLLNPSDGFQPMLQSHLPRHRFPLANHGASLVRFALQQEDEVQVFDTTTTTATLATTSINEEAARLRKEAELARLQAEQMDLALTLQKIQALESKLGNKVWLTKHPDQEAELQVQLQRLNEKLIGKSYRPTNNRNLTYTEVVSSGMESKSSKSFSSISYEPAASGNNKRNKKQEIMPETPLAGFDQEDLDLYIPVANDIIKMIPNGTIAEKLEAFRSAPELQAHFQTKIKKMLVGPLEELQLLENLRQEFLDSTSGKERERLKREIERLEVAIEDDGPIQYMERLWLDDLKPLTDEELARRMEAVGSLPDILIAIYKQRSGLDEEAELSLSIQLDYYEPQLQLLEQVRVLSPLTDEMRADFIAAFNSLPKPVQERFATNMGMDKDSDAATVLDSIMDDSSPLSSLMQVIDAAQSEDVVLYNDIEFVDRSRFLEELFPAIGKMEVDPPSEEDANRFSTDIIDKKTFMVTSKPERVAGGWYIRGRNLLEDDEDGTMTAADKLVRKVNEKLASSPLGRNLEFFYLLDPSPPTDEEVEFDATERPLFVVTTKDPKTFYKWASPLTKVGVTLSGLFTTFMFCVGACAMNVNINERLSNTLDQASETGVLDLQWFADLCFPMFTAFLSIQLAHEVGHRVIGFRDKFDVGFPTIVPSITTGFTGAITPLRSPPPNSKSMFDFALVGPLAGMVVSVLFLLSGLHLTSTMPLGTQLPVAAVDLLRSSSLGGGLVAFFLGSTAVLPGQGPDVFLPLHPYAIAGFVGLMTNAMALLPLGHTDGGRIAVAMFGRRGAFVVKLFTAVLLCSAGLFGLDDTNILLLYTFFVLIWQRELETPPRNEVDELDFPRGLAAIAAGLAVGLTLIPMF